MPRPTLWQRFWAKVRIDPITGCWLWIGARSKGRRGRRAGHIRDGHRFPKAHRLVLTWAQGPPPEPDMEACHCCPNGPREDCVNPAHLYWGSREDNEQDKRRMVEWASV